MATKSRAPTNSASAVARTAREELGWDSTNEEEENDAEEQVSKEVFLRLEPVLRRLCDSVKAHHHETRSSRNVTASSNRIPQLRSMADFLAQLESQLEQLLNARTPSRPTHHQHDQVKSALGVMMEFLTLPLLAILRICSEGGGAGAAADADADAVSCWSCENDSPTGETELIQQSALWLCLERSCRVLRIALQAVYNDNQQHYNQAPKQLRRNIIQKCWNLGLLALPSGPQVEQTLFGRIQPRLDRGEDCLQSLLELLQTLLLLDDNDEDDDDDNNFLVSAVFPRLLETSIAVVEPVAVASSASDNEENHGNGENKKNSKHNAALLWTALETVSTLQDAVPFTEPWRRAFPGVYAGLYRRILLSMRVSSSSPSSHTACRGNVVLRSVDVLNRLLQMTCRRARSTQQQKRDEQSVASFLENLQQAQLEGKIPAKDASNLISTTTANISEEDRFLREINQRLPATLTVLIHVLSNARTPLVREKAVGLHRTLLAEDLRQCWDDQDTFENIITASLEACLVLGWDGDSDVASAARTAVGLYFATATSRYVGVTNAPRIIALIERLPSVAQSFRELELESTLKLILAYLTMTQQHQQQSSAALKSLRAAMIDRSVSTAVVASFKMILDVKFEATDSIVGASPVGAGNALILVVDDGNQTSISQRAFELKYMKKSTATHAYDAIRALGTVFGPKHATMFVDACIADLYEASVKQHTARVPRTGDGQVRWLHEWIGVVRLAQQVLIGGFCTPTEVNAPAKDNEKATNKCRKYLISLAQSILPVLTSHTLWNLPTDGWPREDSSQQTSSKSNDLALSFKKSRTSVITAALRGNAALLCGFLDLIGTLLDVLGPDSKELAPVLLYPMLEKVGQRSVSSVRDAALSVLQKFSVSSGCSDISAMITENWESCLVNGMLGKIRVPGGRSLVPGEEPDDNLLAVVDCATAVFRISAESLKERRQSSQHGSNAMLLNVEEITRELTTRFDYASTKVTQDAVVALKFLHLFDASIELLRLSREHEGKPSRTANSHQANVSNAEPWFDLLSPFKKEASEIKLSPREGFAEYHEEKGRQQSRKKTVDKQYVAELARDTAFISHLAWRCGYLLSHPRLMIQIQSCEVLINCFSFLGWVATDEDVDTDTANGPKTAILRQVHASWPTIEARLKATCSTTAMVNSTSQPAVLPLLNDSQSNNVGEQRVYAAKLLTLIGVMVECSDDFMAKHFRSAVWPQLRIVICSFTERPGRTHQTQSLLQAKSSPPARILKLTESEHILFLSAVRCVHRVYSHAPVGKQLSGMIPSIGDLLFPCLTDEDESIATECTIAIKTMLKIDYDSLWRPLFEMSGQRIPDCPLKIDGLAQSPSTTCASHAPSTKSSHETIATELLAFIDSLPEQSLD